MHIFTKENEMNWILCVGIAIAWILASVLLVWVLCANSRRLSRDEERRDEN